MNSTIILIHEIIAIIVTIIDEVHVNRVICNKVLISSLDMGAIWPKRKRAKSPQKDICASVSHPKLTNGEIESHAMKRVESILKNEESKKLLREFLQKGHKHDKSAALVRLECYELADRISSDLERNQKYLDDLIEVCETVAWEEKINRARKADSLDELKDVLSALKVDCVREMECNHDFTRFRRNLVEKYRK